MPASIHVIGNIPQKLKRQKVLQVIEESGVSALLHVLADDPTFKHAFISQMSLSENPITNLAIDFAYERVIKNGK